MCSFPFLPSLREKGRSGTPILCDLVVLLYLSSGIYWKGLFQRVEVKAIFAFGFYHEPIYLHALNSANLKPISKAALSFFAIHGFSSHGDNPFLQQFLPRLIIVQSRPGLRSRQVSTP